MLGGASSVATACSLVAEVRFASESAFDPHAVPISNPKVSSARARFNRPVARRDATTSIVPRLRVPIAAASTLDRVFDRASAPVLGPYPRPPMKTRTLLLLALGCGLAILLAGGVLLFMLAGQDDPEPPVALGVESSVGDMRVIVLSAVEQPAAEVLTVELVVGGVDDPDGVAGFELIASGRPVSPSDASTCGPTTVEPQPCTLEFDVSTADGESRVLRYRRGDDQVRWDVGER